MSISDEMHLMRLCIAVDIFKRKLFHHHHQQHQHYTEQPEQPANVRISIASRSNKKQIYIMNLGMKINL